MPPRRGGAQEILNSGPEVSAVLKSGIWTSGGFECYLGLRADEAIDISSFSESALDSDSDDHDALPTSLTSKNATTPWGRPERYYETGKRGPSAHY